MTPYYTETDQDYGRALDILVQANEGGTKLSKSDLLLSMVTSHGAGTNAREEIYGFGERINNDLVRKNDFEMPVMTNTRRARHQPPLGFCAAAAAVAEVAAPARRLGRDLCHGRRPAAPPSSPAAWASPSTRSRDGGRVLSLRRPTAAHRLLRSQ
jgi:hypothetical protein